MKIRSAPALRLGLALACAPLLGWAQGSAPSQQELWRQANQAVGEFARGHADVLKWEQRNPPAPAPAQPAAPGLVLAGVEEAVQRAWGLHPDLRPALAQLGAPTRDHIAAGRWEQVEPGLLRRVDDLGEILGLAAQAHKDVVEVVAVQRLLAQASARAEAAQTARELGARMVQVGNWSALQQAPLQLAQAAAQMSLQQARLALTQARGRLLKTIGQAGQYPGVSVDATLPELPAHILTEPEVQARGQALQQQLYQAERFANREHLVQAQAAYQAAFANARLAQEVVTLQQFVTDETVLHYNGMLKSTWEVLAESQRLLQAGSAAVAAQRDFALARVDLEWVLLGGEPTAFVRLGGGADAPAAAGH